MNNVYQDQKVLENWLQIHVNYCELQVSFKNIASSYDKLFVMYFAYIGISCIVMV